MPHQCVKCSALLQDDALAKQGCVCGSKAFFFTKNGEKLEKAQESITPALREKVLTTSDSKPLILDLESIHIAEDGKYELDLHALFGKDEIIYREEEGKYSVDLKESFRRHTR